MSFGKRTSDPKPASRAQGRPDTISPAARNAPRSKPSRSTSLILALVLAACCLAVAWIGYQQIIPGLNTAGRGPGFDKIYVGPQPPNLALLRTKGATAWALRNCTYGNPDEAMETYKKNPLRRTDSFGSKASDTFKNHAEFLGCVAESDERLLCEAPIRAAFAADADKFLKDYAVIAPNMVAFNASTENDNTIANVMRELSDAHPELRPQMRAPRDSMVAARQRVIDVLKDAASQGLVSSRDFGFFAHPGLKSIMNSTTATESACR